MQYRWYQDEGQLDDNRMFIVKLASIDAILCLIPAWHDREPLGAVRSEEEIRHRNLSPACWENAPGETLPAHVSARQ